MIANKFTQAINATYGSNLKAVDLGILFQNHFNLKLFK
jgi:gamma-glutamyltranspeptidase